MEPVFHRTTNRPMQVEVSEFDANAFAHDSEALDEALVESFPASDPVAVCITRIDVSSRIGAGAQVCTETAAVRSVALSTPVRIP